MTSLPEYQAHLEVKSGESVYSDAIKWMLLNDAGTHPTLMGQVSGAANYYAPEHPMIRYDRLPPDAWQALRDWQARTGTTVNAALADFESRQLFGRGEPSLPCEWQPRSSFRWITFWQCPPPR